MKFFFDHMKSLVGKKSFADTFITTRVIIQQNFDDVDNMYIYSICPTYVIYVSLYCDFVTNTIWDTYKGARHGVLSCMEKSFDNSSDMSFKAWHSMIKANLNKNEKFVTNTFSASKMYLHFIGSLLHEIDFRT